MINLPAAGREPPHRVGCLLPELFRSCILRQGSGGDCQPAELPPQNRRGGAATPKATVMRLIRGELSLQCFGQVRKRLDGSELCDFALEKRAFSSRRGQGCGGKPLQIACPELQTRQCVRFRRELFKCSEQINVLLPVSEQS